MQIQNSLNLALLIGLSFALSFGIINYARAKFHSAGFQDPSNSRSLHLGVTSKVGGLGLLPAVGLSMAGYASLMFKGEGPSRFDYAQSLAVFSWFVPAGLVFIICFLSDRAKTELSARIRFFMFSLAASVFVAWWSFLSRITLNQFVQGITPAWAQSSPLIPVLAFVVLMILSILAFTNFYNFMDGMDGLAGCMGLIGFACFGLAALGTSQGEGTAVAALAIGGSCLGFLCLNWPKAKVFMGDTGSTFLGFSASALGWIGSLQGSWHWSFPFLVFFPFWFDASLTLLRRLIQGKVVWQAHREHFYQKAVLSYDGLEMQYRHLRVLIPSIFLMLVSALVALGQERYWFGSMAPRPWSAVMILSLIHGSFAFWAERRYRAFLVLSSRLPDNLTNLK